MARQGNFILRVWQSLRGFFGSAAEEFRRELRAASDFVRVPGTARRYIDKITGREVSRREREEAISGVKIEAAVATSKPKGKTAEQFLKRAKEKPAPKPRLRNGVRPTHEGYDTWYRDGYMGLAPGEVLAAMKRIEENRGPDADVNLEIHWKAYQASGQTGQTRWTSTKRMDVGFSAPKFWKEEYDHDAIIEVNIWYNWKARKNNKGKFSTKEAKRARGT